MKKYLIILAIFLGMLTAQPAQAVHDLVFISAVVKFDDSTCSVELEIFGDNQNGFIDEDRITLNGILLVTLAGVIAEGINDPDGNHNAGAKILAVSSSFGLNILQGDMFFDDGFCASFDQNAIFAFLIDTTTLVDEIFASQTSGFGADNTAISKDSANATPKFINLMGTTLVIANNRTQTLIIGTSSTGGGCSLRK